MKLRGKMLPAERTLIITRTHPVRLLPVLGYTMLAACTWSFGSTARSSNLLAWLGVILSVVSLVVAARKLLQWLGRRYIVTTHRLMMTHSVLNLRSTQGMLLDQMGRRWKEQGSLGKWLGYGSVQIELLGTSIPLTYVPEPERFLQVMEHAVRTYYPVRAGYVPAP